jgi:enoyl-[acyl-carrier protein] reductase II
MTASLDSATLPSPWNAVPVPARQQLDHLWRRGRDFLGCDLAVMGGAMSWVSERNLVAAISNGGGFGVIASGSMSPSQLSAEIDATYDRTPKPFGVNLITLHPQLSELIEVCIAKSITHIVLAGGLPPSAAIQPRPWCWRRSWSAWGWMHW